MALQAIAPPGRAENLIYTILPFSIGLWLLRSVTDPVYIGETLALLGVVTSLGSIVLYEFGFEEHLLNGILKRLMMRTWNTAQNMYDTFLVWNLYVKTWITSLEELPQLEESSAGRFKQLLYRLRMNAQLPEEMRSPYLTDQVTQIVQKTISSNPIKRRVWRIRGFFYLVISFPLLWMVGVETLGKVPETVFPGWLAPFVGIFLQSLDLQTFALIGIIGLMASINYFRHRDLVEHTRYLTELNYLQILIALDNVKHPQRYIDTGDRSGLKRELELLNELLVRGYWSMFVPRWSMVKSALESEIIEQFERDSAYTLRKLWGRFIWSQTNKRYIESSRRPLGWFIHLAYASRSRLDRLTRELIEGPLAMGYKESNGLEIIADPNLILDMMLEKPTQKDRFEELAMVISATLGDPDCDKLRDIMIKLADAWTRGDASDFDDQKTGEVFRVYLLEMITKAEQKQFWQKVSIKALKVIIERLPSRKDRQNIIHTVIDAFEDSRLLSTLKEDFWIEILRNPDTLQRLKKRVEKPRDINNLTAQARTLLRQHGIKLP